MPELVMSEIIFTQHVKDGAIDDFFISNSA